MSEYGSRNRKPARRSGAGAGSGGFIFTVLLLWGAWHVGNAVGDARQEPAEPTQVCYEEDVCWNPSEDGNGKGELPEDEGPLPGPGEHAPDFPQRDPAEPPLISA